MEQLTIVYFFHNFLNPYSYLSVSFQSGMLGSCIAIFILASLYEGLKVLREYLLRRSNMMVRYNTMPVPTSDDVAVMETHKSVGYDHYLMIVVSFS